MNPLKKGDLPPDAEKELIQEIEAKHPDAEVIFVGDADRSSLPPEVQKILSGIEERMRLSLLNGVCYDCGERMPGPWPPESDRAPDGWGYLVDTDGCPMCIECEKCESNQRISGTDIDKGRHDGTGVTFLGVEAEIATSHTASADVRSGPPPGYTSPDPSGQTNITKTDMQMYPDDDD